MGAISPRALARPGLTQLPIYDVIATLISTLPYPYPELAEKMYITSSWVEFKNITKYQLLKKESFFYHVYNPHYMMLI